MVGDLVFYVIKNFLLVLLDVVQFALLIRAILSWFDPMQEWRLSQFLFLVTEPVILPLRRLCSRMHWFEGVPMDMPFMLTWMVLLVFQLILSAL